MRDDRIIASFEQSIYDVKRNQSTKFSHRKKKPYKKSKPQPSWKSYKFLYIWKIDVIQKVGKKCHVCGTRKEIQVHHLLYKSLYPALMYNIANGIPLCEEHHQEIHQFDQKR